MGIRRQYDEALKELSNELIKMGAAATDAVGRALTALRTLDKALAREIVEDDARINAMERDIETMCLRLILKQQPVAADLRKISTAIKMITDIERIGDAASDIAEISLYHDSCVFTEIRDMTLDMGVEAMSMVDAAIDAYINGNLDLADATINRDDVVDGMFRDIRRKLSSKICSSEEDMDKVIDYLMIIKYLERIGDHAVNICEWVRFYVTGEHIDGRIV